MTPELPIMTFAEYVGWCLGTGFVLRIIVDAVHGVYAVFWSLIKGVFQR